MFDQPLDMASPSGAGARDPLRRDLFWYAKRARVMRPAEVMHRIREQCVVRMMGAAHRVGWRTHAPDGDPMRFSFCAGAERQLPDLFGSFTLDGAACEALLAGRVDALGHAWVWRPEGAVWHRAPDTGRQWPRTFFGSIPYRSGNPYGDIRVAWEPARLQHLVALALLARKAEPAMRDRAVGLIEGQLCSWVSNNPFLTGIHYISVMECALRLIAACYALDLVRPWLPGRRPAWRALLALVHGHARLISRRLSVHSSAGNHTIAEAAGLIHAGVLFPEINRAAGWVKSGLSLLEREAGRQILSDGGGLEQSMSYLGLVADLCGLVVALLGHRGRPIPQALRDAHVRALCFLSEFAQHPGAVPRIGDSDGGCALSPFLRPSGSLASWTPGVKCFPSAGYSIVRSPVREQIMAIFDHGPLGMGPCYGHGHADALSVCLRIGEGEVLLDPGTYAYGGDPRWRAYFRGTRAHNTVTVDGLDQAVQEGAFLWSRPYTAELVRREQASDGTVRLMARHDGYVERAGVHHWRGIMFIPPACWLIWDRLTGSGVHDLELHWHLGVEPTGRAEGYVLRAGGQHLCLDVGGGDVSLHRGELDPIRGWRSRTYGRREPITTLRVSCRTSPPHEFLTRLWPADEPEPSESVSPFLTAFRRWIDEAATG